MVKRVIVLCTIVALPWLSSRARAGSYTATLLSDIGDTEKKIESLEGALPQEKFTWRPGEGVRSVSEVYLHIAGVNYLMMNFLGFDTPADVKGAGESKEWESQTTDKDKIQEILKKSFDHLRACITKMGDSDLDQEVKFFGGKSSKMGVLLAAVTHLHEHLGQSIAYARTNGVVPPWTAARESNK